ncbi:Head-to-tail connector protein, podovirus-type, partial [uncultured Caudovirales phage]
VYWDNSIMGGSYSKMNQYQGDVTVETVDPTNIYFDPAATHVEDCNYIVYAVVKSTEWIKEFWGVDISPENTSETDIYNRPILNNNSTKKVTFYEYWYKEDSGLHVVYAAGNKILKHIRNVYKHGRYPFVPFVAKKNRKSILGISECRNLLNNQKLLNKLVEIPVVNSMLVANPILLVDAASGIDANKVTSKPGQIWTVRDGGAGIRYLNPPTLGGEVFKMISQMTEFMERIGGVYDANTGQTPGGVTAASAIQLLQEQGSIPLKGIARNLYATLKEVYEQMVELIKEFYTETRYLRVMGKDGKFEFMEFNALQHKNIDFDIRVSAGASTPTSKAYIAQLGLDLFQQGLLLPSEYVDMLENVPNKDKIVERLRQKESEQPPQQGQSTQQALPQQSQMPSLNDIYQKAPKELQNQIDLMKEQGASDDQIMQLLMKSQG